MNDALDNRISSNAVHNHQTLNPFTTVEQESLYQPPSKGARHNDNRHSMIMHRDTDIQQDQKQKHEQEHLSRRGINQGDNNTVADNNISNNNNNNSGGGDSSNNDYRNYNHTGFNREVGPRPVRSVAFKREFKTAMTLCNSDSPQLQGPGWNGSFVSNSQEGFYPSLDRSCTWHIQAAARVPTNPSIVAFSLWVPLRLICGMDYLTLYDGPDSNSPVIARLCGNIEGAQTWYSSGSRMTAVFTTKAGTPGGFGFAADWIATDTTGNKDFFPRSQHAMAYDAAKDMVYIMGGTSIEKKFTYDLLTYTFATNKWASLKSTTKPPDPRYGHYAFVYDGDLYSYGGVDTTGGTDQVWRYNGDAWSRQQANNQEQGPQRRVGSACVVVTRNNSTKLYVFGGMLPGGFVTRELFTYDLGKEPTWRKIDHKNSVGLSGASAVYHEATDSIYYFGGMVNQTTRNTLVYQYVIAQELWYALGPRIDPFTAPEYNPDEAPTMGNDTSGVDNGAFKPASLGPMYQPAVMYDPYSSVWAPAGLAEDYVIIYGGMRPYGPGVNPRDQSCLVRTCQRWLEYDFSEEDSVRQGRVNHTMVLRPPGSPGGSKTSWTAYIFGGFDGSDRGDLLNVTLNLLPPHPSKVNTCRVLRWCSQYDDCQNCNPNYCSYANGLCLFDTAKAKNTALLGGTIDIPYSGTYQDLLRQRPILETTLSHECPTRVTLDLATTHSGTLGAGEEKSFKIYIDEHDLDVMFQIQTVPNWSLDFKTLNVWEGFMNMYWRANHGLTDDSWDGTSGVSSPRPKDVSVDDYYNFKEYRPIIAPFNASEMLNRWQRYSGLDASASLSGIRAPSTSEIIFSANDPRRFSGYYVFSLTNNNAEGVQFSVTVTALSHDDGQTTPKPSRFDLATLGFFMVGFILAVIVLVFAIRKIRRLMQEREMARHALELRLLEEEEEEEERNRQRNGGGGLGGGGRYRRNLDGTEKKPMYKIVVGVQELLDPTKQLGLRYRERTRTIRYQGDPANNDSYFREQRQSGHQKTNKLESGNNRDKRQSRVRSDYIRDLDILASNARDRQERLSATISVGGVHDAISSDLIMPPTPIISDTSDTDAPKRNSKKLGRRFSQQEKRQSQDDGNVRLSYSLSFSGTQTKLQRGWSLNSLSRNGSLKRIMESKKKVSPEEQEGLTQEVADLNEQEYYSGPQSMDSDDGEQMLNLASLNRMDQDMCSQLQNHREPQYQSRRRNPIRIQPISIEPVPFHGALVPQTRKYLRRYHRNLARTSHPQHQQQHQHYQQNQQHQEQQQRSPILTTTSLHSPGLQASSPRRSFIASRSGSRRAVIRPSHSRGSLRQVQRTASLMTSQAFGARRTLSSSSSVTGPKKLVTQTQEFNGADAETGIEMQDVSRRTHNGFGESEIMQAESTTTSDPARPCGGAIYNDMLPKKPIRMRGRQVYEPGPLLAVNVLIVFPGDSGTRKVQRQQSSGYSDNEKGSEVNGRDANDGEEGNRQHELQERRRDERGGQTRPHSTQGGFRQDTLYYNTQPYHHYHDNNDHDNVNDGKEKEEEEENVNEQRLPPMAIGTVFVPDPVRWWAFKAQHLEDQRYFERKLQKVQKQKQKL
ncbi:hypothetical protein BG004_003649 [Podila humilis]|nr:hypothetical protein BG004_003649 [Podila humilis]